MITVRKATENDIKGIIKVCSDGYRVTYEELLPKKYIEKIISEFYFEDRIRNEILETSDSWNGWFVAVENNEVVGAGGGGFISDGIAELYVLYLNPNRKRAGIGSKLLAAITNEQIEKGALEQWVSVTKDNQMAIPFYESVGYEYISEQPSYELPEEKGFVSLRYKRKLN